MGYETVGACCGENLKLLKQGFGVPPENRALWNLSNALLHLSAAVEADLHSLRTEVRALRQELDQLSRRLSG